MTQWTKEQLVEMYGDDVLDQLAFIAGCHRDSLSNDETIPNGWIITDKTLRKYAELIIQECISIANKQSNPSNLNYKPSERFVEDLRQHFGFYK